MNFYNVSSFLVKYTEYPFCFNKDAKYLVTFKFTTFSYLLFGPTAPTSSAPCPASSTIILFFVFTLEVIEAGRFEGNSSGFLGSFFTTLLTDWLPIYIISSFGANVYLILTFSLCEILIVTLLEDSVIIMLSILSIFNFVEFECLYLPDISKEYS